jgi:hypothetical protein
MEKRKDVINYGMHISFIFTCGHVNVYSTKMLFCEIVRIRVRIRVCLCMSLSKNNGAHTQVLCTPPSDKNKRL